MEILQIIVLICCLVIIAIVALEWYSLRKLLKDRTYWSSLDSKFITQTLVDLKSNLKLVSSVGAIFIIVLTFFGYNQVEKIKSELRKDITQNVIDSVFRKLNININDVNEKVKQIDEFYTVSKKNADASTKYLSLLKEASKNTKIIVVKDIKLKDWQQKLAYSDFNKEYGANLPLPFMHAPAVMILPKTGLTQVLDISKDSILVVDAGVGIRINETEKISFDLWFYLN